MPNTHDDYVRPLRGVTTTDLPKQTSDLSWDFSSTRERHKARHTGLGLHSFPASFRWLSRSAYFLILRLRLVSLLESILWNLCLFFFLPVHVGQCLRLCKLRLKAAIAFGNWEGFLILMSDVSGLSCIKRALGNTYNGEFA